MAFRPRMGTEVEFQEMRMTFVRQDSTGFWPYDGKTPIEQTMIKHDPILVPLSPGAAHFSNEVPWEADWGFIVVGDSFAHITETLTRTGKDVSYGRCVFEANSSAHFVDDAYHWVFLRAALKAFRDALIECSQTANNNFPNVERFFGPKGDDSNRKWYPLTDIVGRYNAKVDLIPLPHGAPGGFDRWHIPNLKGNWVAYVAVEDGLWADAQTNYQMNLESLYTHTNAWLDLWRNIWMEFNNQTRQPTIDPISGHKKPVAGGIVYRNQILAAMWRAARAEADAMMVAHPLPVGTPAQAVNQFKALIMLTLTSAAPTPIEGGTVKNSYSQFPKTSPASIIQVLDRIKTSDINLLANDTNGARAALGNLRNLAFLNAGNHLPAGSPVPLFSAPYATTSDLVLNPPPVHADFDEIWKTTFKRGFNAAPANNFGYTALPPFKYWWAAGAHTGKQAVLHAGTNDIWVLFESRYGLNRLNLIFNPDVIEFPFYVGYLQLVETTMGAGVRANIQAILDAQPDIVAQAANRGIVYNTLAQKQAAGVH